MGKKANFSKTDFLIFEGKKVFAKASTLHYFELERYIELETNALGFAINKLIGQIVLDKSLSNK